uniref:Protein kinase domain-containing protein n=1 Tax=Panagrolaimus sp. ES5 TaxID=591445 RepID=A0AC34FRX8_9BILA
MTNKYVVRRKLGEGGFGAVYQVKAKIKPKNCTTKVFALKTEARIKSPDRLKIEVAVLTALQGCEEKIRERFATMIDRGQTKDFVFIIMTLVGPSLQIIRDNILHKEFTPATTFKIALESLESIKCLHSELGYIHRDIKPGNFTIGNNKNFTKIILIDFGIARKFMNKDNMLRLPRKEVKFLGTVRYASRRCHKNEEQGRQGDMESWFYLICDLYNQRRCHKNEEQGRQGDIESWFYLICDLYNQAVLPWRRVREKDLVFALKNDLRENDGNHKCFVEQLPKEFRDIMLYVDKLSYEDIPDYHHLKALIEQAAKGMNVDLMQKYDWEIYGPPPLQDSEDEN